MNDSVLELTNYGVAFDDKEILSDVTLNIAAKGILVLVGPVGTGKSTLLRTLSGVNNASPSLRTWGQVNYRGAPLDQSSLPVLVSQHNKLMMSSVRENIICEIPARQNLTLSQQRDVCVRLLKIAGLDDLTDNIDDNVITLPLGVQRHLAIVRKVATAPKIIMIDEPTADIEDKHCEKILQYLITVGKSRAVLVVLHNQVHARLLGGHTALLAGGKIQEIRATHDFFTTPKTQPAKDFARTGSCCVPLNDDNDEAIKPGNKTSKHNNSIPQKKLLKKTISHASGPRNFYWLKQGALAGTPKPGLVYDLDYDLKALKRVGIRVLVSLTTKPIDTAILARYGIYGISFPIQDMGCPDIDAAITMCSKINNYMTNGKPVALHCRAGMGRTGTMLVAQLIWEGESAWDAIDIARRIERRWVQSDTQIQFLENFHLTVNKCAKTK